MDTWWPRAATAEQRTNWSVLNYRPHFLNTSDGHSEWKLRYEGCTNDGKERGCLHRELSVQNIHPTESSLLVGNR